MVEETRASLSGEELFDKTEEDIQIMQDDMAIEEEKMKDTQNKVSRELKRYRNQVEEEKKKLDEVSYKISKCKSLQELNEKHKKEMENKLESIAEELEWNTITDFSPSAIEEYKEQINDTEKAFEDEKAETETKFKAKLDNQQEKIR